MQYSSTGRRRCCHPTCMIWFRPSSGRLALVGYRLRSRCSRGPPQLGRQQLHAQQPLSAGKQAAVRLMGGQLTRRVQAQSSSDMLLQQRDALCDSMSELPWLAAVLSAAGQQLQQCSGPLQYSVAWAATARGAWRCSLAAAELWAPTAQPAAAHMQGALRVSQAASPPQLLMHATCRHRRQRSYDGGAPAAALHAYSMLVQSPAQGCFLLPGELARTPAMPRAQARLHSCCWAPPSSSWSSQATASPQARAMTRGMVQDPSTPSVA